jgi:hypothetical protein
MDGSNACMCKVNLFRFYMYVNVQELLTRKFSKYADWFTYIVKPTQTNKVPFKLKSYHPTPWRDSISRPIAPLLFVAGGGDSIR